MILRLLNPQGIAGIAASLCLALLLVLQKAETRHWRDESLRNQELYRNAATQLAGTVANYRAAAAAALAADRANAARVAANQHAINQRTEDDFEDRIRAARSFARRLRAPRPAAADPGGGAGADMSAISVAAAGTAEAAGEGDLSGSDALIATEQAIQLDELIKWVRAQAAVDANAAGSR